MATPERGMEAASGAAPDGGGSSPASPHPLPAPAIWLAAAPTSLPRWATPRRLVALLCTLELIFCLDQGTIGANGVRGGGDACKEAVCAEAGEGIVATFDLNNTQEGLFATMFYAGAILGALLTAQLSKHVSALRLVGGGVALFAAANLVTGFSHFFWLLLLGRFLVGVGKNVLLPLAPPLIDDHAPEAHASLYVGLFYLCFPVGVSLGYFYGGAVGPALGWRATFWIQAGVALPFAVWCLLAPTVGIKGCPGGQPDDASPPVGDMDRAKSIASEASFPSASDLEKAASLPDPTSSQLAPVNVQPADSWLSRLGAVARGSLCGLREIVRRPATSFQVSFGMVFLYGYIAVYGYFGPQAISEVFGEEASKTDFIFGALLAASGIAGTLAGGWLLGRLGSTVRVGLLLCVASVGALTALTLLASLATPVVAAFWVADALAKLAVFFVQAPATCVMMWTVPADLRPLALSVSEFLRNLLGTLPMPPLFGALQEALGNWRHSFGILSSLPGLATVAFLCATLSSKGCRDHREEGDCPAQQEQEQVQQVQQQEEQLLPLAAQRAAP